MTNPLAKQRPWWMTCGEYHEHLTGMMDREREQITGNPQGPQRMRDVMPNVHRWWQTQRQIRAAFPEPEQMMEAQRLQESVACLRFADDEVAQLIDILKADT